MSDLEKKIQQLAALNIMVSRLTDERRNLRKEISSLQCDGQMKGFQALSSVRDLLELPEFSAVDVQTPQTPRMKK